MHGAPFDPLQYQEQTEVCIGELEPMEHENGEIIMAPLISGFTKTDHSCKLLTCSD